MRENLQAALEEAVSAMRDAIKSGNHDAASVMCNVLHTIQALLREF